MDEMRKQHTTPARDFSVLVVEDEKTNALLLKKILEQSGLTVDYVTDGPAGIEKARNNFPDLIILDVEMPSMNGFEVCKILKSDPATQGIPVIFVTGRDDSDSKVLGLSIGGVDYITKPFNLEEVKARVLIHIKLREASRYIIESQKQRLTSIRKAYKTFLTDLGAMPDAQCRVHFESSEEAGGDQYDAVRLGPSIYAYFVADIAGHGVGAGLHSSVIKALFRENVSLLYEPAETFDRINSLMKEYMIEGGYITAVCLIINRVARRATLLSAGHLPPLVSRADGSVDTWSTEGDVLGVFDVPVFKTDVIKTEPGMRFWIYTDGVVEDFSQKRSWKAGMELLRSNIGRFHGLPIDEALEKTCENLFTEDPGADDRLLLVCEV